MHLRVKMGHMEMVLDTIFFIILALLACVFLYIFIARILEDSAEYL